jgi:hypothetical protein
MIKYEKKDYGIYINYSGIITFYEITEWKKWIEKTVPTIDGDFCVFVDMQKMEILPANCKEKVEEVQQLCRKAGFSRSVIILNDQVTALQFKLIARKTGIYKFERYVDASNNEDWEQLGMDWLLNAVDPDKKLQQT